MAAVFKIGRYQYIHVLDQETLLTRLEIGPQNFVKKPGERVVLGQTDMLEIHPMCFALIENPVIMKGGKPVLESFGQVKCQFGEHQYRFQQKNPFPLYPGEKLVSKGKLRVIKPNEAFIVEATRDFTDELNGKKVQRMCGDQWLTKGPKTFIERIEVKFLSVVKSTIIQPNHAIYLRATKELVDGKGIKRHASECWLVRDTGHYLPALNEQIVTTVKGEILTQNTALKLSAKSNFTDVYGKQRKAGEQWLVTADMAEVHVLDVYENWDEKVTARTLSNRQYCVILNPWNPKTQTNQQGAKLLVKGEKTFFLQPGEELEKGVQQIKVLSEYAALLLKAKEDCEDEAGKHKAGDKWMVQGPRDYIPSTKVVVLEERRCIPLDKNEGIYVKNLDTGEVRAEIGKTYLIKENEILWQKEVSPLVEAVLQKQSKSNAKRDKTKVIQYKVQQNCAVQLFNYKENTERIVFGPALILLEPHEDFTINTLSGGTPKREGVINQISLQLGPDFMSDIITVETSDHAQLSLQLTYNWHFDMDKNNEEDQQKLFSIQDFVGYTCRNIASKVRGMVSGVNFEEFQKESDKIIKQAVFGIDRETNEIRSKTHDKTNNLVITSVDVRSSQPVDLEVRKNLDKGISVKMDMTNQKNEDQARHKAKTLEKKHAGNLKCQELRDLREAELSQQELLKAKAGTLAIQYVGEAVAKAKANAEKMRILGEAEVQNAILKAKATKIKADQQLNSRKNEDKAELENFKSRSKMEIEEKQKMADIEISKFSKIIDAIGKETLVSISKSGPKQKAKMLQGLGLKGFLVTDGKNPINLFNTANGMLGDMPMPQQ